MSDELEAQALAVEMTGLDGIGLGGLVCVVVKLLIRKRVFTVDEFVEQVQSDAGRRVLEKAER